MAPTIEGLVKNVSKLTSFPDIAFRIDELLSDGRSNLTDVAYVIEKDPAISAAVLRVANSAAYAGVSSVDTIDMAVQRVGSRELRELAYALCAASSFDNISNELISVSDYWQHCLGCGFAAQGLAKRLRSFRGESVFTAALLHDIGYLVLLNQCPEESAQALTLSLEETDGQHMWLAERKIFGYDHADVGAALADAWHFPAQLRAPIEYHHRPGLATECQEVVALVHVANAVSVVMEFDDGSLDDAPPIDAAARTLLNVDDEMLIEVANEAQNETAALLDLFAGSTRAA